MKSFGKFCRSAAGVTLSATMLLGFAACGGGGGGLGNRGDNITLKVWLSTDSYSRATLMEMENYFNKNVADGFSVRITQQSSGFQASLASQLSNGSVDVVEINDQYAKQYIIPGYLLSLDEYVEKGTIDISDMTESSVDRFRLNASTGDVGEGQPLYAIPKDSQPIAMYYNVTAMEGLGMNIVSIPEEELDAYNEANGTNFLPHGFYEYASDPTNGKLKSSTIGDVTAYRVFNDCIPMNWEELVTLSQYFTDDESETSTTYGYFSEWWFNYGWSVGGDCLENGADGNLKFTLCDETPNYLVTKATEVNGTQYEAGELLSYVDKLYVASNGANDALYELPSQYDAFAQFCALSQVKGVNVTSDGSVKGYGVSPNPTRLGNTSRSAVLTTELAAMVAAGTDEMAVLKSTMAARGLEWGIAPLAQYREYNEDGTLKTVNGTPVTGIAATHNLQSALAICSKTDYPEECAKFIGWWASEEAQKMLLSTGSRVSCLNSLNESEEAQKTLSEAFGCENVGAIVLAARSAMQGDWSYVEDGNWITNWANDLNTNVRNGVKTIDQFWSDWEATTNDYLASHYTTKKYR